MCDFVSEDAVACVSLVDFVLVAGVLCPDDAFPGACVVFDFDALSFLGCGEPTEFGLVANAFDDGEYEEVGGTVLVGVDVCQVSVGLYVLEEEAEVVSPGEHEEDDAVKWDPFEADLKVYDPVDFVSAGGGVVHPAEVWFVAVGVDVV